MPAPLRRLIQAGLVASLFILFFPPRAGSSQVTLQEMERNFEQPPDSAKPRVWWHWLSGNVTQEGITADVEWMKRVNIGGFQMFDGDLGVPVFVDKPLIWMTPDWKAAWRHAAAEADRLHLEMAMAASGGWSETAGPWVKPEQGMKKYVWSETRVEGPQRFSGTLASPPHVVGRFQDMTAGESGTRVVANDLPGAKPQPPLPPPPPTPPFYADVAVVAYRVPNDEVRMADLHPKVTSSAGAIDGAALMDGSFDKSVSIPEPEGGNPGWLEYEFSQLFRAQAVTIATPANTRYGGGLNDAEVQASHDGTHWISLVALPGSSSGHVLFSPRTYTFTPITARFYRILIKPPAGGTSAGSPRSIRLTEVVFYSTPRVNHWEDKAAFGTYVEADDTATPPVANSEVIATKDVIDLTSKMGVDGHLDWQVPPGKWVILRLGYSLTGEKNHPATPAATGLEVDKLNRADVENYMQQYTKMVSDTAGPYYGKSFRYFLMDSWEAGQENWTNGMMSEFRRRRGYDMTPYLPVLTGRIVGSVAASEGFLWDFRRTIADMLAENHYGEATAFLKKQGLGLYAEAMGTSLPTTGDGLLNKGHVSIPMAEFWTPLPGARNAPEYNADVREATSAAHIYGKPIAATESFTTRPNVTPWGQSPFYLKPLADENFARGVNRIVIHTSDEQPFVDKAHRPGITLGPYGQDYTRNITWAEQAVAWNTYLGRCDYLLQQGSFVADVAYFYGEGAPATVPFWKKEEPAPPTHYSYDYLDADVLLNDSSVKNGRIVLTGGMSYKLLVIPNDIDELTLPVLRKIRDLVSAGAVVLSPRPLHSPSLSDGVNSDSAVKAIADQVWGSGPTSASGHVFGKGRVYQDEAVETVLAGLGVAPDFTYDAPTNVGPTVNYPMPRGYSDDDLIYIHRHLPDGEIYFVSTQKTHSFDVRASFRVTGKAPELWHPDTGMHEAAAYTIANGRTIVPLHMDPDGSVFVIFEKSATARSRTLPKASNQTLATIQGPWQVSFPPDLGAPPQVELATLASWTTNADPGVKYFSGTATYSKIIDASASWFTPQAKILLDLGTVREIAEISVNGKPAGGILWKPPFEVNIAPALKPGRNRIEIKVTNLWPNRMIGDLQPGVQKTYTFTDFHAFTPTSPLLDSGLLGPVSIVKQTEQR